MIARDTITWTCEPTEDGDDVSLEFEIDGEDDLRPVWGHLEGKHVALEVLMGAVGDIQLEREYAAARDWWFRGGGQEQWEADLMADQGMDDARERNWE